MDIRVDFDWDGDDWERDIKREIERNTKREYQTLFDRLATTHAGRPKDEIRATLKRELELDDDPDPEWVDAVHDGTRIVVDFSWQ